MKLARLARILVSGAALSGAAACGPRPPTVNPNAALIFGTRLHPEAQELKSTGFRYVRMTAAARQPPAIAAELRARCAAAGPACASGYWVHDDDPSLALETPPWSSSSPSEETGWTTLDRDDLETSRDAMYRAAARSQLATEYPGAKLLAANQLGGVIVVARLPRNGDDGPWLVYSWVDDEGVVTWERVFEDTCPVCGRRPPGLVAVRGGVPAAPVAAWLAASHHLEAASIVAFERIAYELETFGAPAALIARARRAAADEADHARRHAALAAELGVDIAEPEIVGTPPRDEFAFALDNAVDGGVHEAFAAVLAAWQATAARDPRFASLARVIARDEARHGDLAWAIARWIEPRLSAEQRAVVVAARAAALRELPERARRTCAVAGDPDGALGLPSPDQAARLATGFATACLARRPNGRSVAIPGQRVRRAPELLT